jgi:hypothetical protein
MSSFYRRWIYNLFIAFSFVNADDSVFGCFVGEKVYNPENELHRDLYLIPTFKTSSNFRVTLMHKKFNALRKTRIQSICCLGVLVMIQGPHSRTLSLGVLCFIYRNV